MMDVKDYFPIRTPNFLLLKTGGSVAIEQVDTGVLIAMAERMKQDLIQKQQDRLRTEVERLNIGFDTSIPAKRGKGIK